MDDETDFTAYLDAWSVVGKFLCGCIREDSKGRFADGQFVRTSYVIANKDPAEFEEGDIVSTKNSRYKLAKPYEPAEGATV